MVEEKKCMIFGRNGTTTDEFCERNQCRRTCGDYRGKKACQHWTGREVSIYQEEKHGKTKAATG
jgi:hypothetical protein